MVNSITIGTITIHQSENGLYSLADLWNASGKESRHNPNKWLENFATQKLITELGEEFSSTLIRVLEKIHGGKYKGTYVCKELVYSYAMWVSAKFTLLVIRTFDQLTTTTTQQALINLKHQVDNAMQSDLFNPWTSPRDPRSLPAIMHCSPFQANQYNDELVGKGILGYRYVIQTPRRVYHAIKQHPAIIGSKGDTILFNEAELKKLFPTQIDLVDFVGGVA